VFQADGSKQNCHVLAGQSGGIATKCTFILESSSGATECWSKCVMSVVRERILHLTLLWVKGACVLVPNPTCQNLTGTCPPTSMCLLVCSNGYVDCYKLQMELEAQNLIDKLFYQPSVWV